MEQYIPKSALVAEIERLRKSFKVISVASPSRDTTLENIAKAALCRQILSFVDTLEVKEVDIDKLCEFRKNIGFAYPKGASEYQKQLACYRQGIKDVIKAQKGE